MDNNENKGGRPLKFASVDELQGLIDAYFKACDERTKKWVTKEGELIDVPDPRPYTITGLAMALDTTRETLRDYENEEHTDLEPELAKGFSDTIRKAKMKIHNFAEESLWQPKIASGMVFNLTNNWGWRDSKDITTKGEKLGATDEQVAQALQDILSEEDVEPEEDKSDKDNS